MRDCDARVDLVPDSRLRRSMLGTWIVSCERSSRSIIPIDCWKSSSACLTNHGSNVWSMCGDCRDRELARSTTPTPWPGACPNAVSTTGICLPCADAEARASCRAQKKTPRKRGAPCCVLRTTQSIVNSCKETGSPDPATAAMILTSGKPMVAISVGVTSPQSVARM